MSKSLVGIRDYESAMINRLPFYDQMNDVQLEITHASAEELKRTEELINILERNIFVSTSVEKIPFYEKTFGIKYRKDLTIEQRRNQVLAKFLSIFVQLTRENLINAIKVLVESEDVIIQSEERGIYEICIAVNEEIKDYPRLYEFLESAIPAHLMYFLHILLTTNLELETKYTEDKYGLIFCGELQTGEYPHYIENNDIVANMAYEEVYTQDDTAIIQANERTTGDTQDFNLGGAE